MVQVIDTGGNLGTRLGRAVGSGIAEAIPKVSERFALSQGLKNLGNVDMNKPLDAVSNLLGIPGMTLEKAQVLFPFLQQQLQRQESLKRGQMGQNPSQSQAALQPEGIRGTNPSSQQGGVPNIRGLDQQPSESDQLPQQGLVTPESQQALLSEFVPLTYQEKLAAANQLMQQYPASFPTTESALPEVERQEQGRQEQFQVGQNLAKRQEQQQTQAEAEFNKQLGTKLQADLQGQGYGQVWGDLQGDLLAQMYNDVRNGESIKTAAAKYGKIAKEMGETITKLHEIGSWGSGKTPTENLREIQNSQEKFAKLGKQKEFSEILQSTQGLNSPYAHYLAYPLNSNKENLNLLKGLKSAGLTSVVRGGSVKPQEYERIAEEYVKNLKKTDSPLAFAVGLKEKGYDESKFLDLLRTKYKGDLTSSQLDALSGINKVNPSLNANWLFSFSKIPLGG